MSENKFFQCPECGKEYAYNKNLRQHVSKVHPGKVDVVAPPLRSQKLYAFKCNKCDKNFSFEKNLRHHERRDHGEDTYRRKLLKCALCECEVPTGKWLSEHLAVEHEIQIRCEDLTFSSFADFQNWKAEVEMTTHSYYVKNSCSKVAADNAVRHYYYCHRSGHFTSRGKGIRHLKLQGSNKISAVCPAQMKVIQAEDGTCVVKFVSTHIGHENYPSLHLTKGKLTSKLKDIQHRHLSSSSINDMMILKEDNGWKVASSDGREMYFVQKNNVQCQCKLLCHKSFTCPHKYTCTCFDSTIKWKMCKHIHSVCELQVHMEPVTNSSGTNSLISSEDTSNEQQTILAQVSVPGTSNDPMSLAQEKDLLAAELLDLVNGINSVAELNVFKKHIACLKATVTAMRTENKQAPTFKETDVSLNRKAIPHRRLFATKKKKVSHRSPLPKPGASEIQSIAVSLLQESLPEDEEAQGNCGPVTVHIEKKDGMPLQQKLQYSTPDRASAEEIDAVLLQQELQHSTQSLERMQYLPMEHDYAMS